MKSLTNFADAIRSDCELLTIQIDEILLILSERRRVSNSDNKGCRRGTRGTLYETDGFVKISH